MQSLRSKHSPIIFSAIYPAAVLNIRTTLSFLQVVSPQKVTYIEDRSINIAQIEICIVFASSELAYPREIYYP